MLTRRISLILCGLACTGSLMAQTSVQPLTALPMPPPKGILTTMPLGPAPEGNVLHLAVGIPYADPAGMQRFVDSVSDPKSPQYRQFLTPAEVGSRFGMPMSTVNRVASYLTSQGMKITLISPNRLEILADATVAQAQAAFHVSVENFMAIPNAGVKPISYFAYTSAPYVPTSIAPFIVHVGGLENFTRPTRRDDTPPQLRTDYSVAPMYSLGDQGQGRTVGISSYDGFQISNVDAEYSMYNLPTPPGGVEKNISVELSAGANGGAGGGSEGGEGDLDIQCVLGMAPLCTLIIYDGGSSDVEGVLTLESSDNTCDIITESYGWPLDLATGLACHNLHLSMSAQGITYMCASGDYGTDLGSNGHDYSNTNTADIYPDQDPEVMMVAGTTANLNMSGTRTSEICWSTGGDGEGGASGGGWWPTADTFNTLPTYQKSLLGNKNGVPASINYRLVPDIAFNADPNTGYDIYIAAYGGWQTGANAFGGTSCASPTCAGSLADTEQKIIAGGGLAANSKGKQRFGRIQDLLYSYNGDATVFYDVTGGLTIGVLPNGNQALPGTGWDFTTGWGPIIFSGLANKVLGTEKVTALTVSPATVEGGSATAVTGTVTLSLAAPTGGVVVALSSSTTAAKVPASVTVPAGQTTATFSITTSAVATAQTATLTAKYSTASTTATLAITTPHPSALSLSSSSTVGGNTPSVTGTVTLDQAAPTGGVVVALASDTTSAATVPASATVAAGAKTATFTITSHAVAKATTVNISATSGGMSQSTPLTVNPAAISGLTLSSSSVYGGLSVTGTVTLGGVAPTGGASVVLSLSSATSATLSTTSLVVAAGAKTATFTLTTKPVSSATSVTVTAKLGVSFTASVMIQPPVLTTITAGATSALGGVNNVTISFRLNYAAGPSGAVVTLGATPAAAAKFAATTLTIPAGSTSASAVLTTLPVASNTTVSVSGTLGTTQTVSVTVDAATLSTVVVSPASVKGGSSTVVTGKVTLNGPAGPAARSVTLTSSNTSVVALPASVSVAAGATSATFTFTTKAVATTTTVTVTGTLASTSQKATLTVTH